MRLKTSKMVMFCFCKKKKKCLSSKSAVTATFVFFNYFCNVKTSKLIGNDKLTILNFQ